jgi:hypothetical protein
MVSIGSASILGRAWIPRVLSITPRESPPRHTLCSACAYPECDRSTIGALGFCPDLQMHETACELVVRR